MNKLIPILLIIGVIVVSGCTQYVNTVTEPPDDTPQTGQYYETLNISLGEEFVLFENQSARIDSEGYEIKIVSFFKCPLLVGKCVDPHGITIKHKKENNDMAVGGTIKKVPESMKAFGYQTTVIDSDMKTYAKLKVEKIQNKYQDIDLTPVYGCKEDSDCVIGPGVCGTAVYNKDWDFENPPEQLKEWAREQKHAIESITCVVGTYARNPRCENSTCTGDYSQF